MPQCAVGRHGALPLLLELVLLLVVLTCSPRPATGGGKNMNVFHALIQRLGGSNTCKPKAMQRCKPEIEIWHDKIRNHPPVPNGCGSRDLPVKLAKHGDFGGCCDHHDVCFATCGRSKADCDEAFHICMVESCHDTHKLPPGVGTAASGTRSRGGKPLAITLQRCLGEASLYYSGVYGLACGAYKRAQLRHCACRIKAHVQAVEGEKEEEEGEEEEEEEESDTEDEFDDSDWDEDWLEEEFDEEEREEWEK